MTEFKNILIVGAGLAGCTCARLLADTNNYKIDIIEKTDRIGGLCKDHIADDGSCYIHEFGPHIFHTKEKWVWDFVNKFSEFDETHIQQKSFYNGKYYHFPINFNTIEEVYGTKVTSEEEVNKLLNRNSIKNPISLEDAAINDVGERLYNIFIKQYTEKQWKRSCKNLSAHAYRRVSIRMNNDNDLFQNQYQGFPKSGYSGMLTKMITHPNINITFNTTLEDLSIVDLTKYDRIIYTGSYKGLPYRNTEFIHCLVPKDEEALVSLPNNLMLTRCTNFNKLHPIKTDKIPMRNNLLYELPSEDTYTGEGLLPIDSLDNYRQLGAITTRMLNKYKNMILVGRLALYKYFNMDDTIIECFKTLKTKYLL